MNDCLSFFFLLLFIVDYIKIVTQKLCLYIVSLPKSNDGRSSKKKKKSNDGRACLYFFICRWPLLIVTANSSIWMRPAQQKSKVFIFRTTIKYVDSRHVAHSTVARFHFLVPTNVYGTWGTCKKKHKLYKLVTEA